jgi:hypothetical protein
MKKPIDSANLRVCTECIQSEHFSDWIENNGKKGKCDFVPSHGRAHKVAEIARLAIEVDVFFRTNYQIGEEYWHYEGGSDSSSYAQRGKHYEDILTEELECDQNVVKAISDNLPDATHRDITQGDELFYTDQNYERTADVVAREHAEWAEHWYENRFSYQWQDFCSTVQYERRFFKIKELLDDLFGNPSEYDEGTIKPVYALNAGTKLYRARLLDNEFTAENLKANPSRELGAPPKDKARAGRMNVEYIPALYAAFSQETAIAEIRPGIGDQVAIGEFELTRELRVFDFTAFSSREGSDWRELIKHTRYEFITQMESEISKPISPFAKQREYIATQIVSEYLREYFACDAVIYKSAMSRTEQADNRNLVILNRGADFVGSSPENSVSYKKHEIRDVYNVAYTMRDEIPF